MWKGHRLVVIMTVTIGTDTRGQKVEKEMITEIGAEVIETLEIIIIIVNDMTTDQLM